MKQYFKMANVFYGEQFKVGGMVIFNDLNQECFKAVAPDYAKYAAHAISSHDELVQMNQEPLEVLEQLVGLMDHFGDAYGCVPPHYLEYKVATKAIAKAKGGAA